MRKAKSSVSVPTYFALTGYGHCNELAHLVVNTCIPIRQLGVQFVQSSSDPWPICKRKRTEL